VCNVAFAAIFAAGKNDIGMKKIFSFLLLLSMVATLSAQDFEQMKKMRNHVCPVKKPDGLNKV